MNEEIKIEKGIPIPKRRETGLTAMLKTVQVGDSFLWPKVKCSSVTYAANSLGIKCVTRKVDEQQTRIWRIK